VWGLSELSRCVVEATGLLPSFSVFGRVLRWLAVVRGERLPLAVLDDS
jgi:hypothetical protein